MATAALIAWIATAILGFTMLVKWVRADGVRVGSSHFVPGVVFSHFALAAAGLVVWIIYLISDSDTLVWVAFADLVVVAGIGDTLVYRWLKDRRAPAITGMPSPTLAEQQLPPPLVGIHGLFAVATVVLVLLTGIAG